MILGRWKGARPLFLYLAALLAAGMAAVSVAGPAPDPQLSPRGGGEVLIVDVRVEGNRRVSDAGFFRLTTLRSGQPYDADDIRRQFRIIWDSDLFDDLWVEALDAPNGKVVVFHVRERPVVVSVTYGETKMVSQSAVEERLEERDLAVNVNEPLDREKIRAVEEEIKRLYEEKGFLGTTVKAEVEATSENTQKVNFRVKPGAKTLIKKIDFTGNTIYSDGALKGMMDQTIETGFKGMFSKKDQYHPLKFGQELESVRAAYLAKGRLDVILKTPIVEFTQKEAKKEKEEKPPPPPKEPPPDESAKKRQKRLEKEAKKRAKAEKKANKPPPKRKATIIVPIVEGPEYSVGNIEVTGSTIFSPESLKVLIPLTTGDVFNSDALRSGLDSIESLYGQRGYFFAATNREILRREGGEKVADVRVVVTEGNQYELHRVEFAGNTTTRDRVLRRELPISEGEIFNSRLWGIGLTRINQLGYWALTQEPVITPDEEGESYLNAKITGAEQGRNEIQVGGGFSGTEGAFFQGSYATRNFLGRGEILQASLQIGGRSQLVNISFTEPYFMGTNNTVGGSIFLRELQYTDFTRESRGFSLLFGQRLGNFTSWALTYRHERFDEFGGNVFYVPVDALPPGWENLDLEDLLAGGTGTFLPPEGFRIVNSSLIPVYNLNTVNNPFRPSRGMRFRGSFEYTGGFLGGDAEFYKPIVDFTWFVPAFKRSHFAFHAETGLVRAFNNKLIPRSERFFLGGDTRGPRVFETRTLAPLGPVVGVPPLTDDEGNVIGIPFAEVGGDSFFLVQSELVFTLAEPFDMAFFVDGGNAFTKITGFDLGDLRYSAGVEARFYLPIFQAPLRLIWGQVLDERPTDRINSFQFSIGFPF